MNPNSVRLWLVISLLVALGLAPFLARGDQAAYRTRRRNQEKIAAMSESDRQRLMRNLEAYRNMDPAEQDQLQAFHHQLAQDRQSPNGELSRVMDDYTSWLATIEPYQRDQLNQESDPGKRIALMRSIVEEQRERMAEQALSLTGTIGDILRRRYIPLLTNAELKNVMAQIEVRARPRMGTQRSEIESLSGLDRYYRVLKIVAAPIFDGDEQQPMFFNPPHEIVDVYNKIDDLIEDSEKREYFNRTYEGAGPSRPGWQSERKPPPPASRLVAALQKTLARRPAHRHR